MLSIEYWVRRQRKALDLTQVDLANLVGCAEVTIKKIEYGERRPSAQMAELLAEHLAIADSDRGDFLRAARGTLVNREWVPVKPQTQELSSGQDSTAPPRFRPPLFGREIEMQRLDEAWERAAASSGNLVLIEGEAGVGKSRLVEALLQDIGHEATVMRTKCPEMDSPLAYALFAEPLRTVIARHSSMGIGDAWLVELSRLLPELRDQYPNLPEPPQLEPSAERRRLFDAICTTLVSLSAVKPVALFLDDLQWADSTSLTLLNYLSQWMDEAPILVIGAYRPNESGGATPLDELRRTWQRLDLLSVIPLNALSVQAIFDMVQALTAWTGEDPSFGDAIYRETGGNPLFVVETIASLSEERRLLQDDKQWQQDFSSGNIRLPSRVQSVIENRLDRLDELSHEVLTAAAAARGDFDLELVQTVTGHTEITTIAGLEKLLASGMLIESGHDRFNFSHDRIREVAYERLSMLRRRYTHRRLAEIIEERHAHQLEEVSAQLAYHYERAGIPNKARDFHLQAANTAQRQYAHETAIDHYRQALKVVRSTPETPGQKQDELSILISLGAPVSAIYGDGSPEAGKIFEEAEILCREIGQTPQLFRALQGLCLFHIHRANFRKANEFAIRLMELANSTQDTLFLIEARRAMSTSLFFLGDFAQARLPKKSACSYTVWNITVPTHRFTTMTQPLLSAFLLH